MLVAPAQVLAFALAIASFPAWSCASDTSPEALPQNAPNDDLKWQPVVDFDTDSCYNVAAIGPDGRVAKGLSHKDVSTTSSCRAPSDLMKSNVYSRRRCNNGWCVYLYAYYFEKDVAVPNTVDATGHTNDWEHIAVWVQDDIAKFVAVSQHTGYLVKNNSQVSWEGTHPKAVYWRDLSFTHDWRFATDDDKIKNFSGHWYRSPLVSYNGFPPGLRDILYAADFSPAQMGNKDAKFTENIAKARICDPPQPCDPNVQICHTRPCFQFDDDVDGDVPSWADPPPIASPVPPPPPPPPRPNARTIMIVGDSITHGFEGDYTWRYRIAKWAEAEGLDFVFVGPYKGTLPQADPPAAPIPPPLQGQPILASPPDTTGGYAADAGGFDSDHYSTWGRKLTEDKETIANMVHKYSPDMLLVLLGFNDMGWFASDDKGTLNSMKTFIDSARGAHSNIQLLIGNVVERSFIGGRQDLVDNTRSYNKLLAAAIPQWSTSDSPISLVKVEENYDCHPESCPAGHDGLHPNALGEFQIAQAFSRVLISDFKLGKNELSIPAIPPRPAPVPNNLRVEAVPYGIRASWDKVYGAYAYEVTWKYAGGEYSTTSTNTYAYDISWVAPNLEYSVSVRVNNGDTVGQGPWTGVQSAVAHPTTPQGPANIKVHPVAGGATISYDAVPGATEYGVITWDMDTPGAYLGGYGTLGTTSTATDLVNGHRHYIGVTTWTKDGPGLPRAGRTVVPGAGTPITPLNFHVTNKDPTTVQLDWDKTPGAGGYRLWIRGLDIPDTTWHSDIETNDNTYVVSFLVPGTWHFEFCVSAFNGDLESGRSQCFTPPKAPGF